jgi:hypothetical protein
MITTPRPAFIPARNQSPVIVAARVVELEVQAHTGSVMVLRCLTPLTTSEKARARDAIFPSLLLSAAESGDLPSGPLTAVESITLVQTLKTAPIAGIGRVAVTVCDRSCCSRWARS